MNAGPFVLPNMRISKQLFRLLVLFLLFIFLAARFAWAQGIYDQVFAHPELRIHQYMPDSDATMGQEIRFQRVILVQNRGRESASDVYISIVVPDGRITRYRVLSQDAYSDVDNDDPNSGSLGVLLPRLAPSASITVYVWGISGGSTAGVLQATAVADSGSAKSLTVPTALEESENYALQIARAFQEAYHAFRNHEKVRQASQILSDQFSANVAEAISNTSFKAMSTVAVVIFVLAWLFWSRSLVTLLVATVSTLLTWLFFDFPVRIEVLIVVAVAIGLLSILGWITTGNRLKSSFWLALLVFGLLSAGFSYLLYPAVWNEGWVSGSPIVGLVVFVIGFFWCIL